MVDPSTIDPSLSAETIDFGASSLRGGVDVLVGLTLLAHPDTTRVGELSVLFSLAVGGARAVSRLEPDFHAPGASAGRPLTSPVLSRAPLWIRLLPSGMLQLENEGGRARVVVNEEPLAGTREFPLEALERGVLLELSGCVLLLLHRVPGEPDPEPEAELIGESLELRRVRAEIRAIADRDDIVLVRGESGSGKELVARAIQRQSKRRAAPFISVNVGALPAAMAAALLFGHKKGSYTGASADNPGYFGSADGGTLFLDEIGELPRDVQPLLLRALGEGEIQPVGEARPRKVDVRVIAATDANLEAKVQSGEFSLALLRRLEGYTIALPPLSRRRDDLARLFFRFLRAELESIGEAHKLAEPEPGRRPWLPVSLLTSLLEYAWPANVAELHNVARRIALGNRQRTQFYLDPLLARNIGHTEPPTPASPAPQASAAAVAPPPGAGAARPGRPRRDTGSISDGEIVQAMQENGFNVRAAALALGVSRTWLHNRLPHCAGLRQAKDLERDEIEAVGKACAWDVTKMAEALQVSEHGLKLRLAALDLH